MSTLLGLAGFGLSMLVLGFELGRLAQQYIYNEKKR